MDKRDLQSAINAAVSRHKDEVFGFILVLVPPVGEVTAYTSFGKEIISNSFIDYCLKQLIQGDDK